MLKVGKHGFLRVTPIFNGEPQEERATVIRASAIVRIDVSDKNETRLWLAGERLPIEIDEPFNDVLRALE